MCTLSLILCVRHTLKPRSLRRQVESNVFRLHRFFFERDSEFFQKLFAKYGRSTTELSVAGTRVYALPDVIYLEDNVKSVDLERFLGIIYPA